MFEISPISDPSSTQFELAGKPVHGSKAVCLSGEFSLVYTSGLVAPKGDDGRGPIEVQVRAVLDQLRDVAAGAGAGLDQVVKLMAWLPNPADVPIYAELRRGYFGDSSPASTSVISRLVEKDILIEVEAILAVA